MKIKSLLAALALAASLSLAGCASSPANVAAAKPTPTHSVAIPAVSYGAVSTLKDAAVSAGYSCPNWNEDDALTAAIESGTCSDADVFSLFSDHAAAMKSVTAISELQGSTVTSYFAVGPNWVINADSQADAQAMAKALVGTYVDSSTLAGGSSDSSSSGTDSSSSNSAFDYKDANITLTTKTTHKQCFGSAGCNVTVKVELGVDDPSVIPDSASGTVTFELTGDSSGPITDTIDITGSQYSPAEEEISTDSSSTPIKVKVTEVTTN